MKASQAIILAAGMGTRLGPYTAGLPKGMLSFLGEPLLARQVAVLRRAGVEPIVVVDGYCREAIQIPEITRYTNREYATTNMVATLICAREAILRSSGDTLVCYADIIYEDRLVSEISQARGDVTVLVDDDWIPYWKARSERWMEDVESLQYDEKDRLIQIGTPRCDLAQAHSRYIGMIRFSARGMDALLTAFDEIKRERWDNPTPWRRSKSFRQAYMTCMLQELIERGLDIRVAHVRNGWMEFDTVEDYERANEWVQEGTLGRFIKI